MERLINTSNYVLDLKRFQNKSEFLENFLNKNNMTGIELIKCGEIEEKSLNKKLIKGIHLRYYPMWLDFWKNDKEQLLNQFGDEKAIKSFYGEDGIETVFKEYKKELNLVNETKAKYMVFHVSHVNLKNCFDYKFSYKNEEVIDASIGFLNEILKDFNSDAFLLFENLWWPGLDFLDVKLAEKLLTKVNYKNKGFMFDTAHFINTNINIDSEKEAINYILKGLDNLGEIKNYIKGSHFNLSISGSYVKKKLSENILYNDPKNENEFYQNFKMAYDHIFKIDEHKPFSNCNAVNVLEKIDPKFLVYEFYAPSLNILQEYINIQHKALNFKSI